MSKEKEPRLNDLLNEWKKVLKSLVGSIFRVENFALILYKKKRIPDKIISKICNTWQISNGDNQMYQKLYETNEKSYLECIKIVHQNECKTMKQLSSRLFEIWKHFIHCDEIDMIKLLMIRFINTTIFNKMVESDVKMQNKFDKNTNIITVHDRKQCMYFASNKLSAMILDCFHGWGNDKRIVFDELTKQIKFLDFDYFLAVSKIEYQHHNHQKQLSGFNKQAKHQSVTPQSIKMDKISKKHITHR